MSKLNEEIRNGSRKKTRMMERMSKYDVNILEDMVPKLPRITGLVYDKTLKRWRSIVPSIYSSKRTVKYFSVRKYGFKKAWLKALHHICNSIISHLMNNAKRRNHKITYSDIETESDGGPEELVLNRAKLDGEIFKDVSKTNLANLDNEMGLDRSDYDLLYPLFRYMISRSISGDEGTINVDIEDEDTAHADIKEDTHKLRTALFDADAAESHPLHDNRGINKGILEHCANINLGQIKGKTGSENVSTKYGRNKPETEPEDRLYSLRKNPKRSSRIDENYFITNENSIEMLTFDDEICSMFAAKNQESFGTDTLSVEGSNDSFYNMGNKLEPFENYTSDSDEHSKCKDDTLSRNLRNVDFDKYIKALDLFDDEKRPNSSSARRTSREEKSSRNNGKTGKFEALLAATRSSTKNSASCDKVEDQSKIANSLRPWHQCIVWIPSISRWRTLYYDDMSVKHTKTFTPAVFGGVEAAYYAAVEFRNMIDNMNGLTSLATIRRTWNKTGANIKQSREERLKGIKRREGLSESHKNRSEAPDHSKGARCAYTSPSKRKKIEEVTSDDGYSADIQEGLSEHGLLGLDAKYLCMPIPINWQNDCKTYIES